MKEFYKILLDDFCDKMLNYKGVAILENSSLLVDEYLSSKIEEHTKEAGEKSYGMMYSIMESHRWFSPFTRIINMKPEDTCEPDVLKEYKEEIIEMLHKVGMFFPCESDLDDHCENAGGDDSP